MPLLINCDTEMSELQRIIRELIARFGNSSLERLAGSRLGSLKARGTLPRLASLVSYSKVLSKVTPTNGIIEVICCINS